MAEETDQWWNLLWTR